VNAAPEQIIQIQQGGRIGSVWIATAITSIGSHLFEIKSALEILMYLVAIAFTLWQWRRAARKK